MSLNAAQLRQTSIELKENFGIAGLEPEEVCNDLGISHHELHAVLDMTGEDPTTVWRVRDYLEERIEAQGKTPAPYSSLKTNIWYPY